MSPANKRILLPFSHDTENIDCILNPVHVFLFEACLRFAKYRNERSECFLICFWGSVLRVSNPVSSNQQFMNSWPVGGSLFVRIWLPICEYEQVRGYGDWRVHLNLLHTWVGFGWTEICTWWLWKMENFLENKCISRKVRNKFINILFFIWIFHYTED